MQHNEELPDERLRETELAGWSPPVPTTAVEPGRLHEQTGDHDERG